MKGNNLLILVVILSVVAFGCTQTATSSKAMENKEKMMGKEANEMAEIGFEMMNGKMMMVNEKTKTQAMMEKDTALNDGTKVMSNGKVIRKDGTTFMLKEGESIWMDGTFMKAGEMMKESGKGEMMSEYKGAVLAGKTTPYLDFQKEDYDKALNENKKILLYFYASWCPICKREQPETFAAFNDLNDPNLVGFRVHYNDGQDNADAKALVKQFQVPYQHTKVIIKDGKQVLKAPDTWDKQRYLDELAKV